MTQESQKQRMLRIHGPMMAKAYEAWVKIRSRTRRNDWPDGHKNYIYNLLTCEFHKFDEFLKEMGLPTNIEMSVDRIDGSRGYVPGNVRWATTIQQRRNRDDLKLSLKDADDIRKKYVRGKVSQQSIADEYGVNQYLVSAIIRNKIWQHPI